MLYLNIDDNDMAYYVVKKSTIYRCRMDVSKDPVVINLFCTYDIYGLVIYKFPSGTGTGNRRGNRYVFSSPLD